MVEAELDWREWTDAQSNRREAVTFRARQVLFEGGRPSTNAAEDRGEHNGSSTATAEPDAPVDAISAGEASGGADDLPF